MKISLKCLMVLLLVTACGSQKSNSTHGFVLNVHGPQNVSVNDKIIKVPGASSARIIDKRSKRSIILETEIDELGQSSYVYKGNQNYKLSTYYVEPSNITKISFFSHDKSYLMETLSSTNLEVVKTKLFKEKRESDIANLNYGDYDPNVGVTNNIAFPYMGSFYQIKDDLLYKDGHLLTSTELFHYRKVSLVNDSIFFLSEDLHLYRLTVKSEIMISQDNVVDFHLTPNYIYYQTLSNEFHRISLDDNSIESVPYLEGFESIIDYSTFLFILKENRVEVYQDDILVNTFKNIIGFDLDGSDLVMLSDQLELVIVPISDIDS